MTHLAGALLVLASLALGGWAVAHEEEIGGRGRLSYRTAKLALEFQVTLGLLGIGLVLT